MYRKLSYYNILAIILDITVNKRKTKLEITEKGKTT